MWRVSFPPNSGSGGVQRVSSLVDVGKCFCSASSGCSRRMSYENGNESGGCAGASLYRYETRREEKVPGLRGE